MARIVIIGAGLTGLSAAYHLEKRGFTDYLLVEKDLTIGGLCRSVKQDGFTFDYTGHLLHTKDPYFQTLISELVGMQNFNSISRKSYIYSHKRFTKYPFQVNLYGLPSEVIAECIEGFVTRKQTKKKNPNFCEWVRSNFGEGLAKHFFDSYQRKIFDYDLNKITSTWMSRFVPSTSLSQMIEGAITDKQDTAIGYNAQFFYPKEGGIYFWIKKFASHIKNTIYTGCAVQKIDMVNKRVIFDDGTDEPYEILINTMPLDTFLQALKEPADSRLKPAASKLMCNSVVNFNLGFSIPNISEKHWVYFPETDYPFYRIGFPHNFSSSMAPSGCSSLYGEFSHVNRSQEYIEQHLKYARSTTKKLLGISDKEIATEKIIHIPHAYVIYDFWRERNLPNIHKKLAEHAIYSIGRYGEWKYASMQEAVLDGKKIAEQLTIMPAKQTFYRPKMVPTPERIQEL